MVDEFVEKQLIHLNQVFKESSDLYHGIALHFGLSDSTLWLLYSLYEMGRPCTQSEISSTWFISKQTLNSALKNLEKEGYIELKSLDGNRKAKQIVLTSSGELFVKKTIGRMIEAEKMALSALSEKDRILLLSISQRHLDFLKKEMKMITQNDNPK